MRAKMSLSAATLCDGLGQSRVSGVLDPILANDNQPIVLRPATMSDADIILRWQTDPETRRYFRNPKVPLADEHRRWMQEKLADTNCIFNVIMHARQRAGVVRLDRVKDNDLSDGPSAFEISILVDPACYGIGIGSAALRSATMMIPEGRLIAETLPDNTSSQALFLSVGFRRSGDLFILETKDRVCA
ncbi:MAG: GNAT family N-acetyltransferase [Rhodospirillales bacterium]|nr:GNAT family N-acetyltransferase [Rhodospirillales bacterium]